MYNLFSNLPNVHRFHKKWSRRSSWLQTLRRKNFIYLIYNLSRNQDGEGNYILWHPRGQTQLYNRWTKEGIQEARIEIPSRQEPQWRGEVQTDLTGVWSALKSRQEENIWPRYFMQDLSINLLKSKKYMHKSNSQFLAKLWLEISIIVVKIFVWIDRVYYVLCVFKWRFIIKSYYLKDDKIGPLTIH